MNLGNHMKINHRLMGRKIKFEQKCSQHINIIGHYDDNTLIDKEGKLIRFFKIEGLDFFTKNENELDLYKRRRNNFFKQFHSAFAIHETVFRRKIKVSLEGGFNPGFSKEFNDKYFAALNQRDMFHNDLYLAVITKQPMGLVNKGLGLLQQFSHKNDQLQKALYLKKRSHELDQVSKKLLSVFSSYQISVLAVVSTENNQYSEPLSVLSRIINVEESRVPLKVKDVSSYLPQKRLFFNRRAGTIEMRDAVLNKKFCAMLSIKHYAPQTYHRLLDVINAIPVEFTMTQSYRFYDQQFSKNKIRRQQKEMSDSRDESRSQTDQMNLAFDEAASQDANYGAHHFTLACYGYSQEELNKNIGDIIAKFSHIDMVCVREDLGSEAAFWAQLPGNFGYIVRCANISTKNLASFITFHNYPLGKKNNNHWGEALTILETVSGSPYYFNFHYKDIGNFIVVGAMGSGKTVLVGFLILQSMKFKGKRVIFDKDRGLEILVRAMGGVYEAIKPGIATPFNPCQLHDTLENRQFLIDLLKKMLCPEQEVINEDDLDVIQRAVNGLYLLHPKDRQFCHIASYFGATKKGSLRVRFDQWHSEGIYAWLFDHATDSLNLETDVLGFDLSHILDDEIYKTPALMYLMHRITQVLEGERGMLFADEGWKLLNDEFFKNIIDDWSRTPRKKNNFFGLATQSANDTVHSSISRSVNEAAVCKIFFPNPNADDDVYLHHYGLSEYELQLIKTMPDDEHYFLLVFGRSENKQSVVVRANLNGLEDEIAIISGREDTVKLLDTIRAEIGDDPNDWLPIFNKRRKINGK